MKGLSTRLVILAAFNFCIALGADHRGSWTGYVTDTHCGTNCQRTSDMKPDRKCIDLCVKKGSKYGLWSGKQVFVLEPQQWAAKFAAENVKVSGKIANGVIYIESITPIRKPTTP